MANTRKRTSAAASGAVQEESRPSPAARRRSEETEVAEERSIVVHENFQDAPKLEQVAPGSAYVFVQRYEAYRARGGRLSAAQCIGDRVLRVLRVHGATSTDDASLLPVIRRLYQARTPIELIHKLREKSWGDQGMGTLAEFSAWFLERLEENEKHLPDIQTKQILKIYVEGLKRDKALQDLLRLQLHEHHTINTLVAKAYEIDLDHQRHAANQARGSRDGDYKQHPSNSRPLPRRSFSPRRSRQQQRPDAAQLVVAAPVADVGRSCAHCGKNNHSTAACRRAASPAGAASSSTLQHRPTIPPPSGPPPSASMGNQQRGQPRGDRPVCRHCQRPGHLEASCWDLHPELRPPHLQGRGGARN